MNRFVTDVDALEACVGKLPGPRDLKVIDHLDGHATRWIEASPLLFAAFGDGEGVAITAGGGAAGFARVRDARSLALPPALLDDAGSAREGRGFASLFLVPGIGETLRVNGRVAAVDGEYIDVAVEECYLHCAKALIRSGFWDASPCDAGDPADAQAHFGAARFMALATIDAAGHADLSPKGDPAGALLQRRGDAVVYPDRPGNRRVDSFRNILAQPRVAALALAPGSADVLHVEGSARITRDETLCAAFAVGDRSPKLVTCIEPANLRCRRSEAVARARLWPAVRSADFDAAEIFKAHVRLSRARGVQAALVRASLAVPGLLRKGLDLDYEKNLY